MKLYAVQEFMDDAVWRTLYVASYHEDAQLSMDIAVKLTEDPVRMVEFTVEDYDFIAVQARNFAVLQQANFPTGRVV